MPLFKKMRNYSIGDRILVRMSGVQKIKIFKFQNEKVEPNHKFFSLEIQVFLEILKKLKNYFKYKDF